MLVPSLTTWSRNPFLEKILSSEIQNRQPLFPCRALVDCVLTVLRNDHQKRLLSISNPRLSVTPETVREYREPFKFPDGG